MSTTESNTTSTITEREAEQIDRANATDVAPVVFVHGLWLLPSSWDRWASLFEEAGYVALTPEWPDDPDTVAEANAHPEVFAGKTVGQVADHYAEVMRTLDRRPAVIGHSFGGLLAQMLAGRGLSAATVAIDAASFRGVLALPISALNGTF
jgi:pimeloyl-ACP methyl ester carboxylesterase